MFENFLILLTKSRTTSPLTKSRTIKRSKFGLRSGFLPLKLNFCLPKRVFRAC
eukprot:UN10319